MIEHYENDLVERTGLTKKQVREFRRTQLDAGSVRMEKHRWVWSSEAAERLVRAFVSPPASAPLSTGKNGASAVQSAAMPDSSSLLKVGGNLERELVVFRAGNEGVLNKTVLEALPDGVKWARPADRIVVRVYDNRRFKPGQRIVVELMPGSSWLHRFIRRTT